MLLCSSLKESDLNLPHQVFICGTHIFPPLLQFWRCASKQNVLVQDQLDGGEDVERVVHHQGLSYIPKVIQTELTRKHYEESTLASRKLEDSLPEKSTRPAVTPDTYSSLESHKL